MILGGSKGTNEALASMISEGKRFNFFAYAYIFPPCFKFDICMINFYSTHFKSDPIASFILDN